MKSILQSDNRYCYLCRKNASFEPLDRHHVFAGSRRQLSERYGLTVYLHHNSCHIFGRDSVHQNADVDLMIKQDAQKAAMKRYGWTTEEFIEVFGKNYL